MGMDVYGKNEGTYFRANIWSWPPILELIRETRVLPEALCDEMASNSGAGPNASQALRLADALEAKIDGAPAEGIFVASDEATHEGGAAVGRLLLQAFRTDAPPDFSTNVEKVREFIEFSRVSGGFEVW